MLSGEKKQEVSVITLKMVKESTVEYDATTALIDSFKVCSLLKALDLYSNAEEVFYMIALDSKCKPIGVHKVFQGTLDTSLVHPREIYKRALLNNASFIIVAHNHPSGDPTPSQEDIEVTKRLEKAGDILGVELLDHIIVGDNNHYISLKNEKLM